MTEKLLTGTLSLNTTNQPITKVEIYQSQDFSRIVKCFANDVSVFPENEVDLLIFQS